MIPTTAQREDAVSVIAARPPRDPVVLDGVSWEDYLRFRELGDNRGVRMQYHGGRLLLVQLDQPVYLISHILQYLLLAWSERTGLPTMGFGRWTMQNRVVQAATEPDQCWYTKRSELVKASDDSDLSVVPAPDLALEVDIGNHSLHKFSVYAALGVYELWSWNELKLVAHRRAEDRFEPISESIAAPGFPLEVASELILNQHPVTNGELLQIARDLLSKLY